MRLPPLVEARFLRRLNRFAAVALVDGREVAVHVANSGRLGELLLPGARCYLAERRGAHRKTAFDLTLVTVKSSAPGAENILVSADARLPNALVWEAWQGGALPGLPGYTSARREVRYGDSRLDLLLESAEGRCYVEVKSVTLVEEGIARFPDAPTERGRRHLGALAEAVGEGHRAAVVFVVQRADATALAPHDANDPAFGAALREAASVGVQVCALTCAVTRERIDIVGEAPVLL